MSTELYRKYVLGDTGEHASLQRKVWDATPWIIDLYTGGSADPDRDRNMLLWAHEHFGQEAYPFGDDPRPGRWKRGGAYGKDTVARAEAQRPLTVDEFRKSIYRSNADEADGSDG